MPERPYGRLIGYAVAVLATAVCLLIRWPLRPVLEDSVPHMTFFPAVMIAAYFGGLWPGLLATILGAVAANYFLTGHLRFLHIASVKDLPALTLFVLTGAIISGLSESLHRARRRLVAQERQRAEEELRKTEERFRQLAENIHEIYWMMDARDGRFVYISPGYEEVSGRTCQSLYQEPRSWLEILHPDDRDKMIQTMEQYRQGVFPEVEFRLVRPDGSVRWMRSRAFPINDPVGHLSRFAGLAEDITERKRAEEALRESEHRWRSLTEALPQLVWRAAPDGSCDFFSTQWTQHTGVPESELLGWRWLEMLHADDRETTRQFWMDSVAGRGPYDVEYRVRRRDGVYRWFKTRGVPIRDSEGNIVKWFGTCTDITDLRQTEEALRASEERFRGTFENAAVGIAHTDAAGRFLRVNEKFCTIVGYPRAELIQRTFQDITHPDDLAASIEPFAVLMRGESPDFGLEKRYLRKDGLPVWVELFVSLQRDAVGKAAYAIAMVQDISERKRLERELRQAKEAAESANRAKDEFLANVSHEIRTPLNAILGMTELALDTPLAEGQRQCLNTVKSAADNLLGILNDLLDFAKIEAGKLELAPDDFSFRAAVGDTLRALAVRAHKKGLELICHIQPEVPDALVGDMGRLRQILLNLVGNAIKFTERGEVVVRAEVSGDPAPEGEIRLRFTVRDSGIGIPRDRQESIFRAFEQEDSSTTRKYGGIGLGLTIAARLVALMGGHITVDSEPGQGSTFAFTACFGIPSHPPETIAVLPRVVLRDLPVLIVDDNATNRHILDEWLRGWQMKSAAVSDGQAALDVLWQGAARGQPYVLMLLDARMPDMDGLALAAQIRQQGELSATRIILLTSGDRLADLARSHELRVDAHLLKPVQQDELLETIYRVMSRTNGNSPPATTSAVRQAPVLMPTLAGASLRILVAEDNEFNAQLLEQLLGRCGHRVRVANNGREALELVERGAFDLLFLDVHMPELDGFQVVRAVREREQTLGGHLPVIALTARSRKEDRERCLAAGMDDFLSKPVQAADLEAAIERVGVARRSANRSGSSLLDPRVLLAACGGAAVILEKICQAFRARLPEQVTAVRDAMLERNAPRLRETAHKLAGILAAFSTVAGSVASDLEDHAACGQLEVSSAMVQRLETMAQELIQQAGGLSLETLQKQIEPNDDAEGTAGAWDGRSGNP